jgi:outer membrane protein TolC
MLLLACSLWPASVAALTFDEALRLSMEAPRLRGLQTALAERERLDKQLPRATGNPELVLMPGWGLGAGPIWQATLEQSWNLDGLAAARRQAAAGERAALAAEWRAKALEQRLDVAAAWLQLWSAQQQLAAAKTALTTARQWTSTLERAAARGAQTVADVAEGKLATAEAELLVVTLEGDLHDRSVALARATALPAGQLPEATGAPPRPQLPDAAAWQAWLARAAELPSAVAAQLQAAAERGRALETTASLGSALVLGAQAQRDPQGATALLATVGVRWAALVRGERQRAQLAETARKAEAEVAHAQLEAGHQLAAAWHEVEHQREREQVLCKTLRTVADALLLGRQRQFERGGATVFEVLRARQAQLDAERRCLESTGQRAWAEVRAWQLLAISRQGGGQ